MKRKVYLETTIASYLTARPNRDLVIAAHQELTLEWWADHRRRFDTFVSDFVLRESAKGIRRLPPNVLLNSRGFQCSRWMMKRGNLPERSLSAA